jgi:DNA-3-methyladenine glycosylase I
MESDNSYCFAVNNGDLSKLHKAYHDTEYGFKAKSDNALFGSLILEINQAGLSWNTIINKKESIKKAYANFEVSKIAVFAEKDIEDLLKNLGIIRMRAKVEAIIQNAQQVLLIQKEFGSFENWLDQNHPMLEEKWIKLFKKTFKFTGKEITKEFLMCNGYLEGAHKKSCPIYSKTLAAKPMWAKKNP